LGGTKGITLSSLSDSTGHATVQDVPSYNRRLRNVPMLSVLVIVAGVPTFHFLQKCSLFASIRSRNAIITHLLYICQVIYE
jgi:hypothetical protein